VRQRQRHELESVQRVEREDLSTTLSASGRCRERDRLVARSSSHAW